MYLSFKDFLFELLICIFMNINENIKKRRNNMKIIYIVNVRPNRNVQIGKLVYIKNLRTLFDDMNLL